MNMGWFARKQAFSYPAKDIHWSTKKGELKILTCWYADFSKFLNLKTGWTFFLWSSWTQSYFS